MLTPLENAAADLMSVAEAEDWQDDDTADLGELAAAAENFVALWRKEHPKKTRPGVMRTEQEIQDRLARLDARGSCGEPRLLEAVNALRWVLNELPRQPYRAERHCERCGQDETFCRCP